ncbi:MAG: GerMN domain-containing protein [Deltaproteobacteria bacterium]|nr:GerMN domain-containing protein [Deltaproteobacteria bacterium]
MTEKDSHKDSGGAKDARGPLRNNKAGVWLVAIFAAIIAIAAGIIVIDRYGDRIFRPIVEDKIKGTADLREIKVYFVSEDGEGLTPEKRLAKKGALEDEIKEALGMLIEGPMERKLSSAIPEGTKLRGVRLDGNTATADFSAEMVKNHPGGSTYEILTIYSIVDTVAMNFPQVKEVMILVDGKKTETIAGHIDTTAPFSVDRSLIRNSEPKP